MKASRLDKKRFRRIADRLSLPPSEVERAVGSFFGNILSYSRSLPFNNHRKIFKKGVFDDYVRAFNIPFIGRIGPTYSRYLVWRANDASLLLQRNRSYYDFKLSPEDIENLAEALLNGDSFDMPKRKKNSEMFNRVWIVDKTGKKSARQVIPKDTKDVQD